MEGTIIEVSLINKEGKLVTKFHPKQSIYVPENLVDTFTEAIVTIEFKHKGISYEIKGKPIKKQ